MKNTEHNAVPSCMYNGEILTHVNGEYESLNTARTSEDIISLFNRNKTEITLVNGVVYAPHICEKVFLFNILQLVLLY